MPSPMTFFGSLLTLTAIGAASWLFGRLLAGALALPLLRPHSSEAAVSSAILGMVAFTLVFGWLSLLGLPAPRIALVLAGLQIVLLAVCAHRKALDVFKPLGPPGGWAALGVVALTAAVVSLLPLLRTGGFSIGNDTYTYCAFSDWLQAHGFGTPCPWDPDSPVTSIPHLWQQERYPLGAAYFLALVQAGFFAPLSLLVYPAVSAYALVLQAGAVLVAARWIFRLPVRWSAGAGLAFAALTHPVYWGHHNGFLQQTLALPVLILALAMLARSVPERHWTTRAALLFALFAAFLINVYLPVVPLLAVAALVYAAALAGRGRRRGRIGPVLAHLGMLVLLVSILGFPDLRGALARLLRFAGSDAGGHVAFSPLQFLQFALGLRVLGLHGTEVRVPFLSGVEQAVAPVGLALAGVGLFLAWRRPRARGFAAALTALVVGLAYYGLLARDPWSGLRGHTWNVFKLLQWGFPLVLLVEVLALGRLLPAGRIRALVPPVVLAACLATLTVHWAWSQSLGMSMREIIQMERPLEGLPALKRRFWELPPGTLLVVGRPVSAHRWLAAYSALLAYPRPIVGDWRESPSISLYPEGGAERYADLLNRIGEEGIVPILCGFVPFQETGFESLGGGFARLLPSAEPLLIHVVNPSGPPELGTPGRPRITLGGGRTKLVFYSPVEAEEELRLRIEPYAQGEKGEALLVFVTPTDFEHPAIRAAAEGPPRSVVPLEGGVDLSVRFPLSRGLSTLLLSPPPTVQLAVETLRIRRIPGP